MATESETATQVRITEPPLFKILFLNDEVTTMEFVIETLLLLFEYDRERAVDKTKEIHEKGAALITVLPYEIAEQKALEVTGMARESGFPLQPKIERE
tara:strand:+ start:339 stop:632 length:294 start_codon:yes stop_codon:yes gene_type:complete